MRPPLRAAVLALLSALVLAACTLPALESSTPTAPPTPGATRPPSAGPTPTDPAEGSPSPDVAAIPDFTGGDIITTTFAGLRVRDLPGTDRRVITGLLSSDAELEVVMGPIVEDGLGWYLVTDADPDEPQFEEGWVAAGFEPEAYLRSTGRVAEDSPVIVSFAQTGDADFGPIDVPDERHIIRWVAVDPEGVRCQFSILLAAGSGEPMPAIRSTVGDMLIPGILQSSFFVSQPALRGQLFLTAETDCAWTLAVMREDAAPTPAP
ncbi:MAG TPA: SH3 domain-containing protein [Candidatus Limnocylindria bacterium]